MVNATPRPLYPRQNPVPIVQKAGWASVPVWTGAENIAPTGIRSPDHLARSELLYRLRYPGSYPGLGNQVFPLGVQTLRETCCLQLQDRVASVMVLSAACSFLNSLHGRALPTVTFLSLRF